MRRLGTTLLALGALAVPLRAQGPAERAGLARFRDTLEQTIEVAAIRAIVDRERSAPEPTDRDLRRLRAGWALVRLAQLTDSAPWAVQAATEFYEAGIRRRVWPEAWFGLGAAKTVLDGLGVREVRSAHQPAGTGWRQGAILAFVDALRLDPTFRPAAMEAAKLTVRDEEVAIRPGLRLAVERAVESVPDDPLGWFLLARLYRRMDLDTIAAQAYGRALAIGGPTRGVAALELARELFWTGRPDTATTVYYLGAAEAAATDAYRKDLATIATRDDLAAWDALEPTARPRWLRAFWHGREAESGRPMGSRLAAHERRWRNAYERYRVIPAWTRQYEFGMPFRSGNEELDDRGVIYIRHGDPDELLPHFSGLGEDPAQTWVYRRSDGDMIFHFKPGQGAWRAVESIEQINNGRVLSNLIGVSPVYTSLYLSTQQGAGGETRVSPVRDRERMMLRRSLDRGTTTDSDPLQFSRPLAPIIQAYGLGGTRPGEGRLLVVWAVSGRDAPRVATPPGVTGAAYALRARVYVNDSAGRILATIDTLRRFRTAAPLRPDEFLAGTFTLDVPSGAVRTQVMVADSAEGRGALVGVPGIPVPAFAGPPEMGDLVLGLEGQSLAWVRGTTRFPLNPRNAWTTDEAVEILFELDGLTAGATYHIRLGLSDIGADSTTPPRASVEFDQQAGGGREVVHQSLGLRTLRPGRYLLTASVRHGDLTLRRERRITVVAGR